MALGQQDPGDVRKISLSRHRRNRRILVAVAVGMVACTGAGVKAAEWVRSPEQIAADARAPRPSVITAEVELRILRRTVVLRGSVAAGRTIEVTPGASSEGIPVITRKTLKKGQLIDSGTVVAEVSGRPLIVLGGVIPMYRDVRPGTEGPDVKQLQAALRSLGHPVTDRAGVYGAGTQAAVDKLYRDRGYEPPMVEVAPDRPTEAEAGRKEPRRRPIVKAGEIAFVPSFPARVTALKAGLGVKVSGAVVTLSTGQLEVKSTLSAADRKIVHAGHPVEILDEEGSRKIAGRVSAIKKNAQGSSGGQVGEEYEITVKGVAPIPEAFAGKDVRVTIEAASTRGKVLAVPVSAVYSTAGGRTQVVRLLSGGEQEKLDIQPGVSAEGYVEVRAGGLSAGDSVVVGLEP